MTIIRPACPADSHRLPPVERSAGEAFRAIPALAWIAGDEVMDVDAHAAAIAAGACWVADDGGTLAGFLSASVHGPELHIDELAVRHDAQGRGLGRQLIAAAIAHAESSGLAGVTLTTFRDVPWNAPFYARLGFTLLADAGARLSAALAAEYARGMPPGSRCAMRLALPRLSP